MKRFTADRYVLRPHANRFVDFFAQLSTAYCGDESAPELALFVARCCYAMAELCEPLQSSLADEWPAAKEKLIAKGDCGISVWTGDLGVTVGRIYREQFPTEPNAQLLHLMPTLARQVVSEESENGTKIESEIEVPQYLSIPLSRALQFQAAKITKYGAHSLRKNQLRHLVKVTFNALSDALMNLLDQWESGDKISQPIALQLLFDCRYFAAATGALIDQKYQTLEQRLEQLIDPFDLAVLSPNITVNATKAVQKTAVIHGAIIRSSEVLSLRHSGGLSF